MSRYVLYSALIHAALAVPLFVGMPNPGRSKVFYGIDYLPGGSSGRGPMSEKLEAPLPPTPSVPESKPGKTAEAKPAPAPVPKKATLVSKDPKKILVPQKTDEDLRLRKAAQAKGAAPDKPASSDAGQDAGTEKLRSTHGTAAASGAGDTGGIGTGLEIGGVGHGGGVSGLSKEFPFAWYIRIVQGKLWQSWDTQYGTDKSCTVLFTIQRDGSVTDVRVDENSGDDLYDQLARRAVEVSAPFPPLPEGYKQESLQIYVKFKLAG